MQPTLEAAYRDSRLATSYVLDLESPLRREYPFKSMASKEILAVLTKVCCDLICFRILCSFFQDDPKYNAYKRDIAVVNLFFGDSAVFGKTLRLLFERY